MTETATSCLCHSCLGFVKLYSLYNSDCHSFYHCLYSVVLCLPLFLRCLPGQLSASLPQGFSQAVLIHNHMHDAIHEKLYSRLVMLSKVKYLQKSHEGNRFSFSSSLAFSHLPSHFDSSLASSSDLSHTFTHPHLNFNRLIFFSFSFSFPFL